MTTHLFIGDSITDVDRRVDPEELGFGYVRLIAQQTGDHVVNRGVGGDRAIDLEARWEADVLTTTPDTLTVYVGINDTWQRVVGGPETTAATFEATFRRLLSRLPGDVRLVLMEPFVVPVSRDQESWYHDLGPKQRVVRALAEEFGAVFIPLQSVMTQAAAESSASAIAYDGVHPTDRGHELIAAAWLHGTRTWTGRFIAPVQNFPEAPRLRKEFTLDAGHGAIRSAELALSALGVQETWLNGERVGDDLLEPGWTSYEWRIGYRRYDVTAQLADANVLGMVVGNGWYRGHLGWESRSAVYGDRIAGFAELRVVFADGHRQVVATDESWTCSPSEIDSDDLYNGQAIDARRRDDAWLGPGTPPGVWSSTVAVDDVTGRLEESLLPPVRMQEAIAPVETRVLDDDRVLLDFGQNLVGWVRLTVSGASGDEVIVRHAEVLEHGELAVRPLRSAEATDRYRLSGREDLFEPTFTWHGFRYAELRVPRDATWRAEAVVVGSLLTRTGTFHCSDPLVNRLHENVVWSTRGNFLSIPTDCPQRDERLGWTGDIAVFAPTASFLFDVEDFLASWCRDLALEQAAAGVPFVVPDPLKYGELPEGIVGTPVTAIWSDAAIWVPWALWQASGSTAIIEAQFESMTRHLDSVRARLGDNGCWADDGFQFGDWLDPAAPPDRPGEARADNFVVATACAYRSATMFADLAAATERADIAAEARALAERIRAGFRAGYLEPDGRIRSDAPTVYAIAIAFGILTEDEAARSGDRLAALVAENGYRISTGFAGTPYISEALSSSGHHDVAVRLLLERECPSWLYPVTMGATTMWERWDSMLPDGTVNPGEMTSFNHYALGSVADWLHRSVAGLAPAAPGYAAIRFAPGPAEGIDDAAAELETPHGRAAIAWRRDGQSLAVDLVVPDGVPAVLVGPNGVETPVEPGTSTHVLAL